MWREKDRLVAVSEGTHQHEIELRTAGGGTQAVVAKVDLASGKLELYLRDALEDDPE